jgi:hypothetical protein
MEDRMNELDDYLRANRDAYTRDALTRRLVEIGHDPVEVEAAWARIESVDGARPHSDPPAGRPGIGTFLLIGAAVLGYGYVAALGIGGIGFMAYYGSSGPGNVGGNAAATILTAVYALAMVIGLGYSVRRLYRAPSLAAGGWAFGPAFAISVVVLFGINGACLAGVLASSALGAL